MEALTVERVTNQHIGHVHGLIVITSLVNDYTYLTCTTWWIL